MNLFSSIIDWYLSNMNYLTIIILMAIESTFVPLPSELVIPPAAWLAVQQGHMNIFLIIPLSAVGCTLGALINYTLSIYLGRKIIYSLVETKVAKIFFINRAKLEHAEEYFRENGNSSTFIGRLVPGIRHLISIPAGLAKMDLKKFILFTFIGSALWNTVLAMLGLFIARLFPEIKSVDELPQIIERYNHEISYVALAIGLIFVLYLVFKARKKKALNK